MKKGFTLIEMLVVIGIIAILIGASIASFGKMSKSAENAKAQELVSEVATALTSLYNADGLWPKKIREEGKSDGRLDKDVALILAKRGYMSLTMANGKLAGKDRFGIVSPAAAKVIDQKGSHASEGTRVVGETTIQDHILHFVVDLDGDGIIKDTVVGDIRATAAVWCLAKDGKETVRSWTKGQQQDVK